MGWYDIITDGGHLGLVGEGARAYKSMDPDTAWTGGEVVLVNDDDPQKFVKDEG